MDNTIIHFEIPAADVERLRKFYAGVFGWNIERHPGPTEYWMIQTVPTDDQGLLQRPGVNGDMLKKQSPEHMPVNYISVESIEESIEKFKALGGKIVVPKQEVPNVGWIATAVHPEGNPIAMLQPVRM